MSRLRKDQTEALLVALESATSGTLEEITMVRDQLTVALRIVVDCPGGEWRGLVDSAAALGDWEPARAALLHHARAPDRASDAEAVLWALWDLVTELNERRTLG